MGRLGPGTGILPGVTVTYSILGFGRKYASDPTCGQLRVGGQSRSPPCEVATLGARGRRNKRASPWPWKRRLHSGEVRRHREAPRQGLELSSPRCALYRLPEGSLGAVTTRGLPCDGTARPARVQTSVLGWAGLPGQPSTVLHEANPKCLLKVAGLSSFNTLPEQRVGKRLWVQISSSSGSANSPPIWFVTSYFVPSY